MVVGNLMVDQVRGVAAEKAYNKWWLVGMLCGLLLLSLLASAWMFTVADRLPDPLAVHWNSKNEVDNWATLWSIAATNVPLSVGAGGLLVVLALLSRGQNTLIARIGAGFGVAFGAAMSALMVAVVAGQLDLTNTSQATISGPVIAGGLAAAAVLGTLVMWLYRPGDIDRETDPSVLAAIQAAAGDPALAAAAAAKASNGKSLRIKVTMGRWTWAFALGLAAVVGVSTY